MIGWVKFSRRFWAGCLVLIFVLLVSACDGEKASVPGTVFSLGDLPGKRVGVLRDSQADLYATDLELPSGEEAPSVIKRYDSLDDAVDDLREGMLDCVIMDALLTDEYCKAYENLAVLDEAFMWEEYSMCLNADRTELANQLNQALALLEENGTLQEIAEKYIRKEVFSISEDTATKADASDGIADSHSEFEDTRDKASSSKDKAVPEGTLHVATSSGFEPYVYYDENGKLTGFDVDLAYALAKQMHVKIEFTDMDYQTLFTSLADGTADFAIAGIFPTDDLAETCLFTDSYTTACQMVLVRK